MNENSLRTSMLRNCKEVFATMLDVDVLELSTGTGQEIWDVVSLIGFGGDYTGNCMISCSKPVACRIASTLLSEEHSELNGEVMDALGEISNMVFGNVKTDLEEHLGPLRLSIPTVICGRDFNVRSLANPSWIVLPLSIGKERFEARMCVSANHGIRRSEPALTV